MASKKSKITQEAVEGYLKICNTLLEKRTAYDGVYRDVAHYCMPGALPAISSPGASSDGSYSVPASTVGIDVTNTLASQLFSNTVATGEKWFTLRATAEDLNDIEAVADFYTELTDTVMRAIRASNFDLVVHESLRQSSCFGTGIVGCEYDIAKDQLVYSLVRVTTAALGETASGVVNMICIYRDLTPAQAKEEFGDDLPPDIAAKALRNDTAVEQYVKLIMPRMDRDTAVKTADNMPFLDVDIHVPSKTLLREGGHVDFPYAPHRFIKEENSPYGRSPAMNALADLRLLSRMRADFVDAVEMQICPPMGVPGPLEEISLTPGTTFEYDPTSGGQPFLVETSIDLQSTAAFMADTRQAIRDMFFVDKFIAIEQQQNMTATEVVQRVNEKIQAISPVVSRLQSEFMSKLITRTVRLLVENDRAPAVPDELRLASTQDSSTTGADFDVQYTTRLDAKLAELSTNNMLAAISQAAQVAQAVVAVPQLGDIVDVDFVIRSLFHNASIDPKATRSTEAVEDRRAAQAEAAAETERAQAAASMVQPIDMSKAPQPGSPLDTLPPEAQEALGI